MECRVGQSDAGPGARAAEPPEALASGRGRGSRGRPVPVNRPPDGPPMSIVRPRAARPRAAAMLKLGIWRLRP